MQSGRLVVILALATVTVVAAISIARGHERALPPELRLPLSVLHPPPRVRSAGPPVARQQSSELPPWFGDTAAPRVRIAGTVFGAGGPSTVRLAIDVPDPGIWTGRDTQVASDGTFDLGPMRPGRYLLVATRPGLRSRVTRLDTTAGPAEPVELYMASCRAVTGHFTRPAIVGEDDGRQVPAAGIALEIAGQVIGTTDADGAFQVCALSRTELRLGTAGYESSAHGPYSVIPYGEQSQALASEYAFTGTVIEGDGSPVPGVGVQPVWRAAWGCEDSSVVVTTDAAGRFRFGGDARICGLRIWRGTSLYEAPYEEPDASPPPPRLPFPGLTAQYPTDPPLPALELPPIVPLSLDGGPAELTVELSHPLPRRLVGFGYHRRLPLGDSRGIWIRGHVLAGGAPVADAAVTLDVPACRGLDDGVPIGFDQAIECRDRPRSFTRSDGRFAMFLAVPEFDQTRAVWVEAETTGHALRGRTELEVASGESRDGIAIEVGEGAHLAGTVVDPSGRPLAGVSVEHPEYWWRPVTTDRSGAFALTITRQGHYRLRVHADGLDCTPLVPELDVAHPSGELPRLRLAVRCQLVFDNPELP